MHDRTTQLNKNRFIFGCWSNFTNMWALKKHLCIRWLLAQNCSKLQTNITKSTKLNVHVKWHAHASAANIHNCNHHHNIRRHAHASPTHAHTYNHDHDMNRRAHAKQKTSTPTTSGTTSRGTLMQAQHLSRRQQWQKFESAHTHTHTHTPTPTCKRSGRPWL